MTFAVAGVSGVSATGTAGIDQLQGGAGPTGSIAGSLGSESAFVSSLAGAVESLQVRQATSAELAVQAVTGELENVHDYTIAATEAAVALELTAAVRNKAVEAFTEIMRMQA